MKIAASKLKGIALDWAVARAKGYTDIGIFKPSRPTDRGWIAVRFNSNAARSRYDPAINWLFAGALVEELNIANGKVGDNYWAGVGGIDNDEVLGQYGKTQLVAICRCYVQYKLGDEIYVPKPLWSNMIDNILANIRQARPYVSRGNQWILDSFCFYLMHGDLEGFWACYTRIGGDHPDSFMDVTNAMYDLVDAESIDDFEEAMKDDEQDPQNRRVQAQATTQGTAQAAV